MSRVSAFADDALGTLDAVALSDLLRHKQVTAAELMEAAIQRAERVDQQLHAIEFRDYERARGWSFPETGRFAGIPTFIKDNTDLEGWPTRYGSAAVPASPAKSTGAFAKLLLSLGLVPLGKTRLPEFGFSCTTEFCDQPATRNPWHTDYSSGGSSGGAAALVAAGVVPLAHANDGGGSIRIPAACCGLVGLKASRGRFVSHEMNKKLPVKVVCDGLVTRSVRDTAHFVRAAEQYQRSNRFAEVGLVEGSGNKRLRICLILRSLTGAMPCPQTSAAIQLVADRLASEGHILCEASMPCSSQFGQDFAIYWGMMAYALTKTGKRDINPGFDYRLLDHFTQGLAKLFRRHWYKAPLSVVRLRRNWQEYQRKIEPWDVLLSPVVGHVTPKLGFLSPTVPFDILIERLFDYANYTPLHNANGSPALVMPVCVSEQGLPISVQLAAAHGGERTLIELAYEIEQHFPFWGDKPRIAKNSSHETFVVNPGDHV